MTLPGSLIWVLGGLLASGLAGLVLKRGGYGLITDISLGLGGSLVGSLILRPPGIVPESGLFAMAAVALVGAPEGRFITEVRPEKGGRLTARGGVASLRVR